MRLKPRRAFAIALVAAGVGGSAYALSQLASAQFGEIEPPSHLIVESRSELSLCVDGAAGLAVDDAEVEAIERSLEQVLASASNVPSEYDHWSVELTCPPPPDILSDQARGRLGPSDIRDSFADVVEEASPHLVFVYLMSASSYSGFFGDQPHVVASAERLCRGSEPAVCYATTFGLYLADSAPSDIMATGLEDVLNLARVTPAPEPTLDWAGCEGLQPPFPHELYFCERYDDWLEEQSNPDAGR